MKTILQLLAIASSLVLPFAAQAFYDVPYYNTTDIKTVVYFELNGAIMRAICPAQKVINVRQDCDVANAKSVISIADAPEYFRKNLSNALSAPKPLSPLTQDQVEMLTKGISQDQKDSPTNVKLLVQKESDLKAFIGKFGENGPTHDQLQDVESQLDAVYGKLGSYNAYQQTFTDFNTLAQQFILMIRDNTKWSELIDTKNADSLIGAMAASLQGPVARQACDGVSNYGGLAVGDKIIIHQQRPVNGNDRMNGQMKGRIGQPDQIHSFHGVDKEGCPLVELQAQGDNNYYRVRDLEIVP